MSDNDRPKLYENDKLYKIDMQSMTQNQIIEDNINRLII